jgi:hypothetical protein
MNAELEVLARLRAERRALMRERSELLVRGSEAMREIQSLRAARKPDPTVGQLSPLNDPVSVRDRSGPTASRPAPAIASTTGEGRRVPVMQGPADLA